MGSGGLPSGGVTKMYGRVGSLPRFGAKANSRIDLYIRDGKRVQSRWYDHNGIVIRNRERNMAYMIICGRHTLKHIMKTVY